MRPRLWGHDGIRIDMPYAIAKILASPDNPDRPELVDSFAQVIVHMLSGESVFPLDDTSPLAVRVEGVLRDGEDMSMGPVAYVRKVFMTDVVAEFEALLNTEDIDANTRQHE